MNAIALIIFNYSWTNYSSQVESYHRTTRGGNSAVPRTIKNPHQETLLLMQIEPAGSIWIKVQPASNVDWALTAFRVLAETHVADRIQSSGECFRIQENLLHCVSESSLTFSENSVLRSWKKRLSRWWSNLKTPKPRVVAVYEKGRRRKDKYFIENLQNVSIKLLDFWKSSDYFSQIKDKHFIENL